MSFNFKDFYRDKRILVTGGAGFIGSFLVESLSSLGSKVIVVAKPKTFLWRLSDLKDRIKIESFDLSDKHKLKNLILNFRPQLIFHLAANLNTRQDVSILPELVKTNFDTSLSLLELSSKIKLERFIESGTMVEYGDGKVPLTESQREAAISPYSLSKIMTTQTALLFNKLSGLPVCILRFAAVFGPKQNEGMLIPNLIKSCLNNTDFKMNLGLQKRDFVYVSDIVEGMLLAGFKKEAVGEIINLGSGQCYVVKDVAKKVLELANSSIKIKFGAEPYRPLDSMELYMSIKKAKKLLNWNPKTDLDWGLKKTISWYQEFKI